ncbi:MAG: WG repeat-containing protein [Cyanobacteria bacterium SZAS-4]|nr:WG repeat-containing protein [Cyanobacteria bacterium SZAS-4]
MKRHKETNGVFRQHYKIVEERNPRTNNLEWLMINTHTGKRTRFPPDVIPVMPQGIAYEEEPANLPLAVVTVDAHPGVFNATTGHVVTVPYNFETINYFSCGRALFCTRTTKADGAVVRKWGFLDESGKVVAAPIYDQALPYTGDLASVEKNGRWFYLSKTGKVAIKLPAECHRARYFSEGLASVVYGKDAITPSGWPGRDNLLGFIDKTGKIVIKPQFACKFDEPGFHNGLAPVVKNDPRHLHGYIDKKGHWVIPAQFKYAEWFADDGTAHVEYGVAEFDQDRWNKNDHRSELFLAYLVKPGLLGRTREELHKTFGKPMVDAGNEEEFLVEHIGGCLQGNNTFTAHYEDNKVVKFKTTGEWFDQDHPPMFDY